MLIWDSLSYCQFWDLFTAVKTHSENHLPKIMRYLCHMTTASTFIVDFARLLVLRGSWKELILIERTTLSPWLSWERLSRKSVSIWSHLVWPLIGWAAKSRVTSSTVGAWMWEPAVWPSTNIVIVVIARIFMLGVCWLWCLGIVVLDQHTAPP